MTMFSHTFQLPQARDTFQFIPYDGPPKPKQTSRPVSLKMLSNEDECPSIDKVLDFWDKKERGLAPTSHGDEVVDLTCLAGEGNGKISGSGGRASDDGFLSTNEWESVRSTPIVSKPTSWDTGEESLNQPAPSGGSNDEDAIIIEGGITDPDINANNSYEVEASLSSRDFATSTEDGINSVAGRKETQASGLPHRKVLPASPASLSMTSIEQPTQNASDHNPRKAIAPKSHQDRLFMVKDTSRSSKIDYHDDSNSQVTSLNRKRKRSSTKRHIQTSSTICYSDKSSNDVSADSDDCGRHPGNNKRPKLTARPRHSRKQKQSLTCSSADNDDDEYEVEEILNARINRRKLQYRVKWLGYEDDPVWYDASNFKNSPYKLRDFHATNVILPGPPKRLGIWIQCWEGDKYADDHSDDNKPEKYTRAEVGGMSRV